MEGGIMAKEKLYLIDATALLYRAYYAFIRHPLINSKGMNTNAIYGVVNSFLSFVNKFQPQHIIVSFDRKAPTFRHEKSELYKANRPPMPDELIPQVEPVKKFFSLIGLPEISQDGLEADDVLATLANRLKDQYEIVIVSGDKDYSQLVQEGITLFDPMKEAVIGREEVIAKYGVTPEQFVDYLAIVGDSSDNIPGVKGLGPKAAENLLKEYHDLDNIYANLDKLPEKLREKLEAGRENAYLSRELAQMVLNAPIPTPTVEAFHFNPDDLASAIPLFDEYEMPTLKKRVLTLLNPEQVVAIQKMQKTLSLEGKNIAEEEKYSQSDLFDEKFGQFELQHPQPHREMKQTQFKAILTDTSDKLNDLLNQIKEAEAVSLDTETTSLDALSAKLVGISICFSEKEAYYLPVGHANAENLDLQETITALKQALQNKIIIGHNLKYDLTVLKKHGLELENRLFDTMLAAYILDPGTNKYSLSQCALNELIYNMQPISELIGSGKNQITFDQVDVNKACFYSAEDAWAAFLLYDKYQKKLDYTGLDKIYQEIELPLLNVLQAMEETGVHIDTSVLRGISGLINSQLKDLTDKIYQLAGYKFNLNSTQQLAKLLFEDLKLPIKKKTKTGISTDNSVLEDLADEYEIAALLIEYRQLTKLESTYVSALPKMINPQTGRVHSSFNQTMTSTGRLSSSNPNLQNIPIRTELGREIRKAFSAPDKESVILSADYSQIELRLLALMSEDPYLLDAFAHGIDIHRQTAAYIYNKPLAEVTPEERRKAKVINFGLLYGMGPVKLSHELGITQQEAKDVISHYFNQFQSVKQFILQCHNLARQKHYCETLFGRRLYLPYINSSNLRLKSEAERVSLNMPIQGTAADLIKLAMIDIYRQIKKDEKIKLVLQVHDELVFEVRKSELDRAIPLIKKSMSEALPEQYRSIVTLEVEAGYGASWFEAHA